LLTARRRLLVDIKAALKSCKSYRSFSELIAKNVEIRKEIDNYHSALDDISDADWLEELSNGIFEKFEECMELLHVVETRYVVLPS